MPQWHTIARLSEHMDWTSEGFLAVRDVPVSRCGMQLYHGSEIPALDANEAGWIEVDRQPEDVFELDSLASFNGKPITDDHPDTAVDPDNWHALAVGHVENPRRGMGQFDDCVLCDFLFTARRGIDAVLGGKRAVSVGYDAAYDNVSRGRGRQRNIRVNHVALVDEARCGPRCTIADARVPMLDPLKLAELWQARGQDALKRASHYVALGTGDAEWSEAEHPRVAEGSSAGGQFTAAGSGATGHGKSFTSTVPPGATTIEPHRVQNKFKTDTLGWMELAELDRRWARDLQSLEPLNEKKLQRAKEYLSNPDNPVAAPIVHVTQEGALNIVDGRHRLGAMRALGHTHVPVAMSEEAHSNYRALPSLTVHDAACGCDACRIP